MIPEFPEFKGLELGDKEEIEKFTSKFSPYSDFNFISMWSWDIKGEIRISKLNNNLVARFTDYLTGNPFFSFLGDNMVNETAETLIEFSKKQGLGAKLKLVPEEIANILDKSKLAVSPDVNSNDYIYSISYISKMRGWTKNSSGKNIRSFVKNFPNYAVKHHSIKEIKKGEYMEMFKKWAKNKGIENYFGLNEGKALNRIFGVKYDNVNVVSIYVSNILVGFTIYEILSSDYAISHFAKADKAHHRAICDVLNWEEAKILDKQGIKYFNWEQDLGLPGLRKSKEKYKPSYFLKKFIVSRKEAQ